MSRHPRDAVILGYVRTPFGRYAGSLSAIRPDDLASHVIRAVLERTDVGVAGGVESMSRAPLVTLKPSEAFPRGERILVDTTLGWRLTNPRMIDLGYHPISLGETAENVAAKEHVGRPEQDSYAARSQD